MIGFSGTLSRILAFSAIAAFATGCGSTDDTTVPASGAVTLDGQPLPSGNITFLPSDGNGATAGAEITDGRYEGRVPPGPKQVTIVAQRPAAGSKAPADPHAGPPMEQYLPARYNTKTELKAEIPASGSEAIDFQLMSGKQ